MRIINRQDIDIEMMDENSLNGAQNVGVGQNRVNNAVTGDKLADDASNGNGNQSVPPQYTIPGILHFIEHEWQRFQAERSQWDTDRAELQVSVEFVMTPARFSVSQKSAKHFLLRHTNTLLSSYMNLVDFSSRSKAVNVHFQILSSDAVAIFHILSEVIIAFSHFCHHRHSN